MPQNPLNRNETDELFDAISKGKKKEDSISQGEIDFLLSGGASGCNNFYMGDCKRLYKGNCAQDGHGNKTPAFRAVF
ncbi:MAG: hypothetical protein IJ558_13280 [Treponema sp.]|nr:hypothetical protein [Treponema sp.]